MSLTFLNSNFLRRCTLCGSRCFSTPATSLSLLDEGVTGQIRTTRGWISSVRHHKSATFYTFTDDHINYIQVVSLDATTQKIDVGSAVELIGTLEPSQGRNQKYDFILKDYRIIGQQCLGENAVTPYTSHMKSNAIISRQHLSLRPRLSHFAAFLHLRSAAKQILHDFFVQRNFVQIDTPAFTTADCEGAGESFYVLPSQKSIYASEMDDNENEPPSDSDFQRAEHKREFFGRPVFLTVSSQMHLEACANSLKKVYSFNPAFRAESSLTKQHLAEFYMLEVEIAFLDNLEDLLMVVEQLLFYFVENIVKKHGVELSRCFNRDVAMKMNRLESFLALGTLPRITYDEALQILSKEKYSQKFSTPACFGENLKKEHEMMLVEHFGNVPLIIIDYPANLKPFYVQDKDVNGKTLASCFDLLAPFGGELCGGSLRQRNYEKLKAAIEGHNWLDKLSWYADLRLLGYAPTAGFGLGFERLLQWILGVKNIRDCIPFPRWYKHCRL